MRKVNHTINLYAILITVLLLTVFVLIEMTHIFPTTLQIKLVHYELSRYASRIINNRFHAEKQIHRVDRLKSFCMKYKKELEEDSNKTSGFYEKNFIYSDQARALYCYVPKAACTTWKRMFQMFEGNFVTLDDVPDKDQVHELEYQQLNSLSPKNQTKLTSSYYSFIFSRHPLDRLFAAYRNKFLKPFNDTYYKDSYGPEILQVFRPELPESAYNTTTVTFLEFIKYVLSENGYQDQHWAPMYKVCNICEYRFDYLGKHETLHADASNVIHSLNLSHKFKFPDMVGDYKTKTTKQLKKYYKDVPEYIMKDLYKYYEFDFKAFGYDFHTYFK